MGRRIRKLTTAATLPVSLALCTACATEATPPDAARTATPAPLDQLEPVALTGDSLSTLPGPPEAKQAKPLGEVRQGNRTIVAFTQGKACGLAVADKKNPEKPLVSLTSEWPRESDGIRTYAAGPYSFASTPISNGSGFAALRCSKNAAVVEYSPRGAEPAAERGHVSVVTSRKAPKSVFLVFGPENVRNKISAQL